MNKKLLLEVYLPATQQTIEVKMPRQIKVWQAMEILIEYIVKQDSGFIPTADSILCDMETGNMFPLNEFLNRLGIHNGTKIMLI